jgi:hypothetical protein
MRLICIAALLASSASPVAFEADGVRLDGVVVKDAVLQLKDSGAGYVLASKSALETLSAPLRVEAAPGRFVTLNPGLRIARGETEGFVLTAHGRKRLELTLGSEKSILMLPLPVVPTEKGWRVAGRDVEAKEIAAKRVPQDETDQYLNQLNAAANRLRNSMNAQQPAGSAALRTELRDLWTRLVPLHFPNYRAGAGTNTTLDAISTLLQASPIGN